MVAKDRWDYMLDKAVKETGLHPARLCLAWPNIIASAHRNRHMLGAEETQRLAEVQWWGQLFPGQPFREDWTHDKNENNEGKNDEGPGQASVNTYKSCWVVIKEKALRAGITLEQLIDKYQGRLNYCIDHYLRKYGQAVTQFRAELLTWRDLFPDEVFIGIDPQTGAQNLRTSNDVRFALAAEERGTNWGSKGAAAVNGGDIEMVSRNFDARPGTANTLSEASQYNGRRVDEYMTDSNLYAAKTTEHRDSEEALNRHERITQHEILELKPRFDRSDRRAVTDQEDRQLNSRPQVPRHPTEEAEDKERERREFRRSKIVKAMAGETTGGNIPAASHFDEAPSSSKRTRPYDSTYYFDAAANGRGAGNRTKNEDFDRPGPPRDLFETSRGYSERGRRGSRGGYRGRGRGRGGDYRGRSRSPTQELKPRYHRERSPVREYRRSEYRFERNIESNGEFEGRHKAEGERGLRHHRDDYGEYAGHHSSRNHPDNDRKPRSEHRSGRRHRYEKQASPVIGVESRGQGMLGADHRRRESSYTEGGDLGDELRSYGKSSLKRSDRKDSSRDR